MPAADVLWWVFLATVLAVAVLVGALGVAMVIAQRRVAVLHRAYARRLLAVQEEERARVARDVHDDAIQRLAMLRHELREFEQSATDLSPAHRRHLAGIAGEVQDLTAALRQLAHRLHPAAIQQAGLVPALEQLADECTRESGVAVRLSLPSDPFALPAEVAIALFRIAQEALRNAIRHAGVPEVAVDLRNGGEVVELLISDRGCGFDPTARRGGGIGLISIEERARLVGGRAVIQSRPGDGATVAIRVPRGGRGA